MPHIILDKTKKILRIRTPNSRSQKKNRGMNNLYQLEKLQFLFPANPVLIDFSTVNEVEFHV